MTFKEIRAEVYKTTLERRPFLSYWKMHPYTFLKARFYMESSVGLVWLLLKTNIKPSTVTIIYGLAGIITGILLSIPNNYTICIALLIAFTKGILDWSDGHLARITGQTSLTGHILDIFGAHLNSIGFQTGLGMYVAYRADTILFYYLVPLLLFFRAGSIYRYFKAMLFDEIFSEKYLSSFLDSDSRDENQYIEIFSDTKNLYGKYKNIFMAFLDDRARSVDFICLIILLEIIFPINISWIIFLLILMKYFIIFAGSIYIIGTGSWAEDELTNKLKEIYNLMLNDEK